VNLGQAPGVLFSAESSAPDAPVAGELDSH